MDFKEKTFSKVSFKSYTRRGIRNRILSFLLSLTRTQLLDMIDFPIDNDDFTVVDLGCNIGYITRPLSSKYETIGMDIDKEKVRWAKKFNRQVDFICCDACHLPLRNASIDIVVGASVLEHIENLSEVLREIKIVLKNQGKLVAGYPLESRFLEVIFQTFWKSESRVWNQSKVMKIEDCLEDPHIHKQNFSDIRTMLGKDFSLLKRQKIPYNYFPDLLSIYENTVLLKK